MARVRLHVLEVIEEGLKVGVEVASVVNRGGEGTVWYLHFSQIETNIDLYSVEKGNILEGCTGPGQYMVTIWKIL